MLRLVLLPLLSLGVAVNGNVSIYPWPAGAPRSSHYTATAEGLAAPVLETQGFSWVAFGADWAKGPVRLEFRPARQDVVIAAAIARPLRLGLVPQLLRNGTALGLVLTAPAKLSVDITFAPRATAQRARGRIGSE